MLNRKDLTYSENSPTSKVDEHIPSSLSMSTVL